VINGDNLTLVGDPCFRSTVLNILEPPSIPLSRQRRLGLSTIGKTPRCPWQRDSNQLVSGKVGAVQYIGGARRLAAVVWDRRKQSGWKPWQNAAGSAENA